MKTYNTFTWSLLPVGIIGLATNSLNVVVYTMVGFQDTVSFSFLGLSVCDLCFIITNNIVNLFNVITLVERPILDTAHGELDTIAFYGEILFDISACVKTFIAVQRGCCVAFPFLVNRIFTKENTLGVILCLYLLNLVSYSIDECMKWQTGFQSSTNNVTYYLQVFTSDWLVYNTVRRFLNRTDLVCACEILVPLSLFVIVYGMSSTSKWRQLLSVGKINKDQFLEENFVFIYEQWKIYIKSTE